MTPGAVRMRKVALAQHDRDKLRARRYKGGAPQQQSAH